MAPAQTRQVIAHRPGRIAERREFVQANRAVAFRQFLAILAMDQRDVGENRPLPAHRVEDLDLAGGVGQVIVAPDHMGHAHVVIIHHDRQHVGRGSVAAQQHHVVQLIIGHADRALHGVVDAVCGALRRIA